MQCSGAPGLEQAPGAGIGNAMRAPGASLRRVRPEPRCPLPELPAVPVCMVAHSGLPRQQQYIEAPLFVQLQHILAPEPKPQAVSPDIRIGPRAPIHLLTMLEHLWLHEAAAERIHQTQLPLFICTCHALLLWPVWPLWDSSANHEVGK